MITTRSKKKKKKTGIQGITEANTKNPIKVTNTKNPIRVVKIRPLCPTQEDPLMAPPPPLCRIRAGLFLIPLPQPISANTLMVTITEVLMMTITEMLMVMTGPALFHIRSYPNLCHSPTPQGIVFDLADD